LIFREGGGDRAMGSKDWFFWVELSSLGVDENKIAWFCGQ